MKTNFNPVQNIGEFGLIDRIKQMLSNINIQNVIIDIGDDTAVIQIDKKRALLTTCDIQIENTHFRLDHISPYQLGRRSITVNLSDIASMGGQPTFALVSLGLPGDFPVESFDQLFEGMRDELAKHSAHIIGGNLANTQQQLMIDIFMLGDIEIEHLVTRKGAKVGDRVFVTGYVGHSAAGFHVLEKYHQAFPKKFSEIVQKHLLPTPRLQIGKLIAQSGIATAMIDISDGLVDDLLHICESSHVGAKIYQGKLQIDNVLNEMEIDLKKEKYDLVLHGGEDYELLFTVNPDISLQKIEQISRKTNTLITEIGMIIPKDEGTWIIDDFNNQQLLLPKGWNHFN